MVAARNQRSNQPVSTGALISRRSASDAFVSSGLAGMVVADLEPSIIQATSSFKVLTFNNNQQQQQQASSASSSSPSAQSAAQAQLATSLHSRPANQAVAGASPASSAIATPSQQQQQQPSDLSTIGQHSATPSQQSGGHKSPGGRRLVGGELPSAPADQFAGAGDEQFRRVQQQSSVGELQLQQQQQQATTNVILQQQQLFCSSQTSSRNSYWNLTRAGQVARQACPDGSSGLASWPCRLSANNSKARFSPAWSPNFSQCKSIWLQRLGHQLDQALTASRQQHSAGSQVREVLNDLAVMAPIKELFGEDLRLIDTLVGKIINHHEYQQQSSSLLAGSELVQVHEELFGKLVHIVSSLFDVSQRNAWLELPFAAGDFAEGGAEKSRRQLEQSLLSHLKHSGALLTSAAAKLELAQHQVWRQANVFAAITVISNDDFSSKPNYDRATGELVLQLSSNQQQHQQQQASQAAMSANGNLAFEGAANGEALDYSELASDEVRIPGSLLRELSGYGVTRLLLLDVKKPDYAIVRQQLEHFYSSSFSAGLDSAPLEIGGPNNNNLLMLLGSQPQWNSRVFGMFAIVGETGQVLGDDSQQSGRQWPISVHFKLAAAINHQQAQAPQQVPRQCTSLGASSAPTGDRCQSLGGNSTNHACRCDQLGFVELATSAALYQQSALNGLIVPLNAQQQPGDFQWPQMFGNVGDAFGSSSSSLSESFGANGDQARAPDLSSRGQPSGFVGPQGTSKATNGGSNKQSVGVWATIFIVFGLCLLVVSLAAFVVGASLRASAQSRLSKKQAGFLGASSSMLGHHNQHHHHHHHGEPTTGPLAADHGLIGGPDGSTQSTSIIGLTQAACHGANAYNNYKAAPNQQLYHHAARHLSSIGGVSGSLAGNANAKANRWTRWTSWLTKPAARWLPFVVPSSSSSSSSSSADSSTIGGKLAGAGGMTIQHRVLVGAGGSSLVNGGSMVSYKSQYQNGYTTNLHHQSTLAVANSRIPLAAPTSSSTSSYVSSSAYYEEIGPGNLTKVNTSQLQQQQQPRAHTIVDPFKREAPDQQQLLHSNAQNNHLQQQLAAWPTPTTMVQTVSSTNTTATSGRGSYSMEQASHYAGQPMLAQSQQSFAGSSSAGSQHSANSNNLTTTGSTPRHYLFASPSAVNAYKSSMSQQQHQHQHYLNQKQQQNQFKNHTQGTQNSGANNFTMQG